MQIKVQANQIFATHSTISLKDKPIEDKKDIEIPAENNEDNSVEKLLKPKRTKKNFQCKECNKSFRDNYKLKRHEKVHMKMKLPEKTLDGQNLGEAYDSYLKGNLLRGVVNLKQKLLFHKTISIQKQEIEQ